MVSEPTRLPEALIFIACITIKTQIMKVDEAPKNPHNSRRFETTASIRPSFRRRFDMRHWYFQFCCYQRTGHRGVHVSDDNDQVRPVRLAYFFKFDHDFAGLLTVIPGADTKINIRFRNPQIFEKEPGHLIVIVLTGVDQERVEATTGTQLAQ